MTRIVWFHPRPLLPLDHGGNLRTHGLVTLAARAGHDVLLVTPGGGRPLAIDGVQVLELTGRTGLGRSVAKVVSRHPLRSPRIRRRSSRAAHQVIAGFAPELAVVSESMTWSVAADLIPSSAVLVYDAHNVETELYRDLTRRARGWFDRLTLAVDLRRVTRGERSLLARSTGVLAVSDADRTVFTSAAPGAAVWVVPSSVATPDPVVPSAAGPECLFVGTLDYPPNRDAVEELVTQVWPEVVRVVPDALLRIVGRRASRELRSAIAACSGADLLDDVDDLSSIYARSRCVVIPLRSGGGSRLKVYEALAYGVPIVATEFAIGGLGPNLPGAVTAETSGDLAAEICSLLSSDDLVTRLGGSGRAGFLQQLAWDQVPRTALLEALSCALESGARRA